MTAEIDQNIVHSLLDYDPETGVFRWRERGIPKWDRRFAGKIAGCVWRVKGKALYWAVAILGTTYLAHRVAHLWMTGAWPDHEIDHEDVNGLNNRWSNLRPAGRVENGANRRKNINNKTGFKGVSMKGSRYRATIQVRGKSVHLGFFDRPEPAAEAYRKAADAAFGEFARCQ